MTHELERPTILIVDDTPVNIDLLAEILPEYRSIAATDGPTALRRLDRGPVPDMILLDVMMPGMDGFEVCRRIRLDPAFADIPIIFVTAKGDTEAEHQGLELGAVDYISKPFSPPVVRARVRTHLSLRFAHEKLALHNAELEEQVAKRTESLQGALDRLRDSSLETIVRLSRAAEFKDDDTGAHVLRMSHYTAIVARQMGLPDREVELLLHAAPMHDIGKIGIPDRILLKPGRLDAEEWVIMRRHSQYGADILAGSDSELIRRGAEVALTHHERWDGSGYPGGLRGEKIPISGRIVAVSDVFDALTSRRPYKEPFSLDKSFGILQDGAGNHFDPAVVDAFFSVTDEILDIKNRFSDEGQSPLRCKHPLIPSRRPEPIQVLASDQQPEVNHGEQARALERRPGEQCAGRV